MEIINQFLEHSKPIHEILRCIRTKTEAMVHGVSDTQKRHLAFYLARNAGLKGIYIAWNEMQARQALADLAYLTEDRVVFLPDKDIMLYDVEARSYDQTYGRISALVRILEGDYDFIVTSAEAIVHRLMPPAAIREHVLRLKPRDQIPAEVIEERLMEMGYEREEKVEGRGQYARRGGILDIFPINADQPCRVEFFDIEIDSLRAFSQDTQRSTGTMDELIVYPAREIFYAREDIPRITDAIKKALDENIKRVSSDIKPLLSKNIQRYIGRLEESHYFTGVDKFIPFLLKEEANFFDYVHEKHLVVFEEPERTMERLRNDQEELQSLCETLMEKGMTLRESFSLLLEPEEIIGAAKKAHVITFAPFEDSPGLTGNHAARFGLSGTSISPYSGKLDLLTNDIRRWSEEGYRIYILVGHEDRVPRFIDELREKGYKAVSGKDLAQWPKDAPIVVGAGSLQAGFIYHDERLVVITESDILAGRMKKTKGRTQEKGKRISSFTDLKVGDYVVHQSHGIGVYNGIEQLTVEGIRKDYLKISYKDGGSLYIPTTNMDLIQKYIGSEGREPRLNKLGGTEWVKTKSRVKESLKELATSLIKLQAERMNRKGHAFMSDTVWQRQFEEAFPFEETPDQLRCIEEIKHDMESDLIMDRLLCGDVGYGKTEVALRAVFKAVMDGKQVAFVVPTTVLCAQHYENFKKRFSGFPITVEMLSRFRTDSEQRAIIKDLKSGRIDIIVGTHMLFSEEVRFKDLGLLVIDEEQRFGVEHKETIKSRYPSVDILTLSATPIPRTLNMSLAGIRDISTIEDPPEHRYPVQTYVVEYRDDIVRDAIHRELARGGQVFYLYNRVHGIQAKLNHIQSLVPEAHMGYAHGQMGERELERVIQSFLEKDFDVLVCTTIIESGIDMPNVNTIIVEDSDRLGLAQLYQLRGRVGRSNRLAYAYLTYKRDKVLNEIAEKRLKAIREFTEFGSGFKIAMRDMQIRGAGNLLGAEQHGHLETVGYDMYLRLLDETVTELKGEKPVARNLETTVEFQISAYIDARFISDEDQRIDMYRAIAAVDTEEAALDIRDELIDRYGEIPEETEELSEIAQIKNMAASLGFSSIKEKEDMVVFNFSDQYPINMQAIGEIMGKWKGKLLFSAGKQPYLSLRTKGEKRREVLTNIKILLQDMQKLKLAV